MHADWVGKKIVVFDGVCNLCNNSVQFILKHDKKAKFHFATNQSESFKLISKDFPFDFSNNQTIVYARLGKIYTQSTAALFIAYDLGGLFKLLVIFLIIPPFIRNFFYRIIAKNRYKWFGKRDTCMMPSQELAHRFL